LDSHNIWHWLEQVAIVEKCDSEHREETFWGEMWTCGWKTIDMVDVKLIPDVQKIIDKSNPNQFRLSESYQICKLNKD
jgi:hypothetical protein